MSNTEQELRKLRSEMNDNVGVVTGMVTVGRIGGWIISSIRASLYAQYLSI